MDDERTTTTVGSFKEAAPIVSWKNSIFRIQARYDGEGIQLHVGLYDKDDNRIEVHRPNLGMPQLFHYLPLPTWNDQQKALGFMRRVAKRRQNERQGQ